MAIQAHLVELERKHKILENELHEALVHLSTDDLQIVELKRRKLMVKDEIERLKQSTTLRCISIGNMQTRPDCRNRRRCLRRAVVQCIAFVTIAALREARRVFVRFSQAPSLAPVRRHSRRSPETRSGPAIQFRTG